MRRNRGLVKLPSEGVDAAEGHGRAAMTSAAGGETAVLPWGILVV